MEDENSHSIEYEESIWGPHEFCNFKCGPDCDQVAELHTIGTVICDVGHIIEGAELHWDDGDWSVGIRPGYWVDDSVGIVASHLNNGNCLRMEEFYILTPQYASQFNEIPDGKVKELAKKYLETSSVHV